MNMNMFVLRLTVQIGVEIVVLRNYEILKGFENSMTLLKR